MFFVAKVNKLYLLVNDIFIKSLGDLGAPLPPASSVSPGIRKVPWEGRGTKGRETKGGARMRKIEMRKKKV